MTSLDEDTNAIERYVESIAQGFLAALNNRNFDIETDAYRHKFSDFVAEGGYLFANNLSLKDYLAGWVDLVAEYPELYCKLLDWNTYVDLKAGFAQVFCNLEVTGRPTGLVRKSVIILEYKCNNKAKGEKWNARKEDWLCTRFRGVRGANVATAGGVQDDMGMMMG